MTQGNELLPYDDLVEIFEAALARALSGSVMPPSPALPDGPLISALIEIAHAVREGLPTNYLVSRACSHFAQLAARQDEAAEPAPAEAQHLKAIS